MKINYFAFLQHRTIFAMNTHSAENPTKVYTIIANLLSVVTVVATVFASAAGIVFTTSGKILVTRLRSNQPTNARLRPPMTKMIKKIRKRTFIEFLLSYKNI